MMDILKTDKLTKIYGREENKVEALKDVSISVEKLKEINSYSSL